MSTWKSAKDVATGAEQGTARKPVIGHAVPHAEHCEPPPEPAKVEVVRLEIDLDVEPGGDPYNCTGQHLIDAIRQYEE